MAKNNLKEVGQTLKIYLEKQSSQSIKSENIDLLAKGIISSFGMLELLDFIEKKFKVSVDITTLNPGNFNSLKKISKLVNIWMSK